LRIVMLISAATAFRIDPKFAGSLRAEELSAAAAEHAFRACGPLDLVSFGWTPPMGRDTTDLIHAASGRVLLALQIEEKLLPAVVIRQAVEARIADVGAARGHPPGKRERAAIKEAVVDELMPRAFSRLRTVYGFVDPPRGLLVVGSSADKSVERFTGHLRRSLGSLPVHFLQTASSPRQVLTRWLSEAASVPPDLTVLDECVLEHEGVVRCRALDLASDEIRPHLAAGREVSSLGLAWDDRLSFVLDERLRLRRLRPLDRLQEALGEVDADSLAASLDAEFTLTTADISELLDRLVIVCGGEES
jgi:recombination associated protein RdgC